MAVDSTAIHIACCSSPSTHKMSPWVKRVFLHFMPRLLMMRRPPYSSRDNFNFEDSHFPDNGYTNELEFR
jgi:nicotinic acetylcholine receptor